MMCIISPYSLYMLQLWRAIPHSTMLVGLATQRVFNCFLLMEQGWMHSLHKKSECYNHDHNIIFITVVHLRKGEKKAMYVHVKLVLA